MASKPSLQIQTKPAVCMIPVFGAGENSGEIIETALPVTKQFVEEAENQGMTQLVGLLFTYNQVGTKVVREIRLYNEAQLELVQTKLEYNRLVETEKASEEAIKELKLSLVGLMGIEKPDMSILDALRNEIVSLLTKQMAVHAPKKDSGNMFYSTSENAFQFAARARQHNSQTYMAVLGHLTEGETIDTVQPERVDNIREKESEEFILMPLVPLNAFAAQILEMLSSINPKNLNDIDALARYLDGPFYAACELGVTAIQESYKL